MLYNMSYVLIYEVACLESASFKCSVMTDVFIFLFAGKRDLLGDGYVLLRMCS